MDVSKITNSAKSAKGDINGVKDGITNAKNEIAGGVEDLSSSLNSIKDELGDLSGNLKKKAEQVACQLIDKLKGIFNAMRPPVASYDPVTILGGLQKPGMSTSVSVGNVISKLGQMGIPTGPLPDGSPNENVMLVTAIMEETQRMIREDMNSQIALMPGSVSIIGYGANEGGPVEIIGNSTSSGVGTVAHT